jgi:GT2 family glycosyltransferase
MITIGFVILTWNSAAYVKKCIDSIFALRRITPKISVVDNGSSDGTKEILRSYGDKIILTEFTENKGQTVSRNASLARLPETDYVAFLDSDTVISDEEGFLLMAELLKERRDIGIVGPRLVSPSGELQYSAKHLPRFRQKLYKAIPISYFRSKGDEMDHEDYADREEPFYVPYLISACILMRYDAYRRIGTLDERIFYGAEDVEYCMRAWKKGLRVAYDPRCTVVHHYQRIGRRRFLSKHNYEHLRSLLYVRRKYPRSLSEKIGELCEESL